MISSWGIRNDAAYWTTEPKDDGFDAEVRRQIKVANGKPPATYLELFKDYTWFGDDTKCGEV